MALVISKKRVKREKEVLGNKRNKTNEEPRMVRDSNLMNP